MRKALEAGDSSRHETAIGGFVVEGVAKSARLILCHGAGAGHDSEFLARLRRGLAARGIQVVAVEFGYMTTMRREGRRRPPPRIETLVTELAEWQRTLLTLDGETPLWLGGKSMGGRVASLLATQTEVAGLVLCGYPFHPPGKPTRLRLDHWSRIACPLLLFQGTRDPFGRRDEVEGYDFPAQVECHFMEGGDHDWQAPKRHLQTQSTLIDEAVGHVARRLGASE
ncbi:dienelactone hydrolase [Salinicola socius]|uniref:Dienelactone hydrolase n=1 Tax=Salinicola socius TaxID=404433 RepID=A0A1Q8SN32_9GAMM|nr:dienelactone hydrolase [Salinicola socius]